MSGLGLNLIHMRINITLEQVKPEQIIPIDYQYQISSFIYRTIELSNNEFSKWLHDTGFIHGSNKFKFFAFSFLDIEKKEILPNHLMKIISPRIGLTLTFITDISLQHLIAGIFLSKQMKITHDKGRALFDIRTIEMIPEPEFKEQMWFRTLSPLVTSKTGEYQGKKAKIYLSPRDDDYLEHFKRNLEQKYITFSLYNKDAISRESIKSIKVLNAPKSKLTSIAVGKESETKIKGYMFDFQLTGNPDMMRIGYETGFGNYCSLGFGCVRQIK